MSITFVSVNKILKCDHSNESYLEALSCDAVYYAVQGGSIKLLSLLTNLKVWSFNWKYKVLYKVVLTFEFVDEILKCDHSNESYWAVLSCGAIYYAVQGYLILKDCEWGPPV